MRIVDWEGIKGSERLDSRDIQSAYEDLLSDIEGDEREPTEEEQEFIDAVDDIRNEVSEWDSGAFLIEESDFENHAMEVAEEIGAIPSEYSWPASHIDWEAATTALQQDYSSVSFLGYDYYVRN